jgi:WD40 repeat protein
MTGHDCSVVDLSLSESAQLLASTGLDRFVRVWDLITGVELHAISFRNRTTSAMHSDKQSSLEVVIAPNATWMAVTAGDMADVEVWNPRTGQQVGALHLESPIVTCLAGSPDSRHLAVGTKQGRILLCDMRDQRAFATIELGIGDTDPRAGNQITALAGLTATRSRSSIMKASRR